MAINEHDKTELDRPMHTEVTFNVTVIYDEENGVWMAECDLLGIITEAKTFELLSHQVQNLIPDMIAANQIKLEQQKVYLKFSHLKEIVI